MSHLPGGRWNNIILAITPGVYWALFLMLYGNSWGRELWNGLLLFECVGVPAMIVSLFALQLLSRRAPFAWTAVVWFSVAMVTIGLFFIYCVLAALPFSGQGR